MVVELEIGDGDIDMKLTDHKVLVTGGSAGIGLALAREFVRHGNRVAICGRDPRKLAFAQAELGDVETLQYDLAEPTMIPLLAEQAAARLDGLSILVNNAGVQNIFDITSTDAEQVATDAAWEIQVNLTSVVALTAACLPYLRKNDPSAVINISSGLAITPKAASPVYCATKAALHSLSQTLRYQMEDSLPHVHVFEVLPPLVDTDMTRGRGTDKLSPEQVARETFRGLRKNRFEIPVGKTKMLSKLNRVAPGAAAKILRNA